MNFKAISILIGCSFFILSCGDECPIIECNSECLNGNIEVWDEEECECIESLVVISGCTDEAAKNYNPSANCSDNSCEFGCSDPGTCNTDCDQGEIEAWVEESCECLPVPSAAGCTNTNSINYDPSAICDDGSCEFIQGCINPCSTNFDPQAKEDDGTCINARDAFIGNYLASINCPMDPSLMLINTDSLTFNIVEGLNPTNNEEIILTFTSGVLFGLVLEGEVCKDKLFIPETLLPPDEVDVFDINIKGDLILTGNTIEGDLNMEATFGDGSPFSGDLCTIIGIKL